ncbi:MAG TPA: radical SAM protein [Fimbriimonadaceae bacterium]|nr:radical SAM protein [Fimbriimonadaceae bacterium]
MSTLQPALFAFPETCGRVDRLGSVDVTYRRAASILNPGTGSLSGFDFSLNPYTGCQFGCAYCYAAAFVPSADKADAWGQWVEVKENAVELLRRRPDVAGKSLYIGSVTDPYQPLEAKTELTRAILEHLASLSVPPRIVIQTRGPLVARDIDVLRRFPVVRVNMSITTDCDTVRKRYEPCCASIARRFEALRDLKEAGIAVGVCISPMLPIIDAEAFAVRINALRPDRVSASGFHISERAFAANTRAEAWDLLREDGWDAKAYHRTMQVLRRAIPQLTRGDDAFVADARPAEQAA